MSRFKAALRSRKFSVLAVCLLLAVSGAGWWLFTRNPLEEFAGRDLRKLEDPSQTKWRQLAARILPEEMVSPRARLQRTLDRILPEKYCDPESHILGFEPWRLWPYAHDSGRRLILLQVQPLRMIPGESRAAVHFLSESGKHLGCNDFSIGNRYHAVNASFRYETNVNCHIIAIETAYYISNSADTCLMYAVRSNRVALIRVEGLSGQPERPINCDLPQPELSIEEHEQALDSSASLDVLETLTWIGSLTCWRGASLIVQLRNNGHIQTKLAKLCNSDNPWIRDAAVLARQALKD